MLDYQEVIAIGFYGTEDEARCWTEKSGCFEYGNGTQTVIDCESVRMTNWGRPLVIDTRYTDFNKCGGFRRFCEGVLTESGFTVL